jgi:tRNA modification GTPase
MTRTIFAPATPRGKSGVAIIRISGPLALSCLAHFKVSKKLTPRTTYLCSLYNASTQSLIDKALLVYFPAPYSFTGEDIIEIHHHGGIAIKNELIQCLTTIPEFFMAEAGEFARQAFYNHKLDLAETEGLADLIDAETETQKRLALNQMSGALSEICMSLREDSIQARALMEAILDFPDEDIPKETYTIIDTLISSLLNRISAILSDNHSGEKIREGFVGVIVGAPNVGKSTLLNTLAKRDVAIVSDVAGTTRDTLEVHLDIQGYAVTIIDTAGLRETNEVIEAEGIRRAIKKIEEADFIIQLLDIENITADQINTINHPNKVVVYNKVDLATQDMVFHVEQNSGIMISAKTNSGIDKLSNYIVEHFLVDKNSISDVIITRERHRTGFENARKHFTNAHNQTVLEIKAEELRLATNTLSSIVGLIDYESILDALFSNFCIGK